VARYRIFLLQFCGWEKLALKSEAFFWKHSSSSEHYLQLPHYKTSHMKQAVVRERWFSLVSRFIVTK
jgi:hypothetical protein